MDDSSYAYRKWQVDTLPISFQLVWHIKIQYVFLMILVLGALMHHNGSRMVGLYDESAYKFVSGGAVFPTHMNWPLFNDHLWRRERVPYFFRGVGEVD